MEDGCFVELDCLEMLGVYAAQYHGHGKRRRLQEIYFIELSYSRCKVRQNGSKIKKSESTKTPSQYTVFGLNMVQMIVFQ